MKAGYGLRVTVHLDGTGTFDGCGTLDMEYPDSGEEWAHIMSAIGNHLYGCFQLGMRHAGAPAACLIEFIPLGKVSEIPFEVQLAKIPGPFEEGWTMRWTDAEVSAHG